MWILDSLVKGIEAQGYPVKLIEKENRSETHVTVLDEDLAFRVEEEIDSKERPLTREQKEDLKRYGHYYNRKIDYFPTGRLRIRISQGGYDGQRKS